MGGGGCCRQRCRSGRRGTGPTRAHHTLLPPPPQLTLLLVLEDRLHRQLTYDLLPSRLRVGVEVGGEPRAGAGVGRQRCRSHALASPAAADSAQDLAAELVHYGFVHEVRCAGWVRPAWEGGRVGRAPPSPMPPSRPAGRSAEAGRLPGQHLPQVPWSSAVTLIHLRAPSPLEANLLAPWGSLALAPAVGWGTRVPVCLCAC